MFYLNHYNILMSQVWSIYSPSKILIKILVAVCIIWSLSISCFLRYLKSWFLFMKFYCFCCKHIKTMLAIENCLQIIDLYWLYCYSTFDLEDAANFRSFYFIFMKVALQDSVRCALFKIMSWMLYSQLGEYCHLRILWRTCDVCQITLL